VGAIGTDITERKQAEEALRESEERFRAVIEYSPGVIIIKDLKGRYLITNKMFCDWYRTDIRNIRGKTVYDFLTKESADHVTARDRKVVETGTVVEEERRVTYPDGVTRDILAQKFPIFGPDGDCVAVGTVINDITDRKEAEEALKESEDRFRGFAEMSSDWFWEMGPDLRFTYFSPRYAEITGFPIEDRIGSRRSDFIPAEDLEANAEEWAAHLADLEARRPFRNFEYSTTASSEGLRFVRVSGQPAFGADGEFLGYRGTGTDITQRKKTEKDLREAKEQAESASGAKTDFLANMSHELRTPLNSILGFSEILLRETLGPLGIAKYKEYAGDIHASGTHLLGLINEVLDLSKLEAGEFEIDESEIDVVQAVNSCVKMVERRSTGEMASVTAEFADGLPRLLGDEKRLKQILLNLLGNAVKFTPPGGKVKVAARICERGRHTIEVSDNGVGIAEEDISKVLEPFGQARDVHTRDHEGTGLGLYLAKSFTEMHGGTLDIVSGLGKGTTVTLRFPKERTLRIH
ncbi:MAG: PAS domain-containing sensor histidine kinase, partial [Proteobacteria bacterium]|nr:PAS domain-containing sensor histidine kinase [Pseudomonadota bacterium]